MQLQSNGTNTSDQYIRITTVGNITQTVNSSRTKYDCSWYRIKAMNCTQQHKDSTKLSVPGCNRTYNALVSILLSRLIIPLCQRTLLAPYICCDRKKHEKISNILLSTIFMDLFGVLPPLPPSYSLCDTVHEY